MQKEINELLKTVKNVTVFCSKSGKMTNELINKWSTVLICTAEKLYESEKVDILLLLDSYTAHWNEGFHLIMKISL